MDKLKNDLLAQLKSKNSKDAEDCLKIYNKLLELESGVWDSKWNVLVNTRFEGTYPNSRRISSPSSIGKIFLAALQDKE